MAKRKQKPGDKPAPGVLNGSEAKVDGMLVPHVFMFNSIAGSSMKAYLHGQYDDARRNDPEFAEAMLRDPHLQSLLQEREKATATKRWEVIIGDQRNPQHKAISDSITSIIEKTPRFMSMTSYVTKGALWAGRSASEVQWDFQKMQVGHPDNPEQEVIRDVPVIVNHVPVNGDKIGHLFSGEPYLLVNGARGRAAVEEAYPDVEIITTTGGGMGAVLRGKLRRRFIIHQHEAVDADFRHGEAADAIHGVGIRSVLFWLAWLKKELLANILEFCERTGLGLKVWYYQGGNQKSEDEVKAAAAQQTDRTNLVVPRFPGMGGRAMEGVEFVDTASSGAAFLMTLLDKFDDWTERYVIGQTLSSGTEGSGLGGSGVADLHADTKFQLTSFDAVNLGETYTADLVRPLLRWCFPKFAHLPHKFQFVLVEPDAIGKLNAMQIGFGMGADYQKDEVRAISGGTKPQEGDEVLSMAQQAQDAAQMQMQAMGGQPGAEGQGEPQEEDYASIMRELMGGQAKGGDGASEGSQNGQLLGV